MRREHPTMNAEKPIADPPMNFYANVLLRIKPKMNPPQPARTNAAIFGNFCRTKLRNNPINMAPPRKSQTINIKAS
jgi:hypothetical protein